MNVDGGCYCRAIRYHAEGEPILKAQCHCRECQYISGGGPNMLMIMPEDGFSYTQGEPRQFTRLDLANPVTREFCADCGTHLLTRAPALKGALVLKVGSLDDPKEYGGPQMAIFCCDRQPFHTVAEGLPTFDRMPG